MVGALRQPRDPQPAGGTAASVPEAREIVRRIGYPALVRPSYVLGGRAMEIVYDDEDLDRAVAASLGHEGPQGPVRPVLIDRFLEDAIEVDVDAIRDAAGEVLIGAVMEHVEEAGVHSGDSACVIPPPTLDDDDRGPHRGLHAPHRRRARSAAGRSTSSTP